MNKLVSNNPVTASDAETILAIELGGEKSPYPNVVKVTTL